MDMQLYETQKLVPEISQPTLIHWFAKFRKICAWSLNQDPIILDGDISGNVIEIDESLFNKKHKYHKRRGAQQQIWVFGAVERHTRKAILKIVHRRDQDTLLPIIKRYIKEGSVIHSDEWRAYLCLSDEGYQHATVNHTEEFRSESGVCTNNIEGIWSLAKLRIKKMKGVFPDKIELLLAEFMYRYRYGHSNGDVFWRLMHYIKCLRIHGHAPDLAE